MRCDDRESVAFVKKPRPGEPDVPLRDDYLARLGRVESLPENQSGTDKTWVAAALEESLRHFEKARRIR
ncbi:MAG TPA: hypothetical protein VEK15_12325 [Vicinamibacteria bacterium]|nr:hypothetical protein [Vicinamibacteria bacterium]